MSKRLTNLLKILESRDSTTPGLAERIARVKSQLGEPVETIPEVKPEKKKKKKILKEIEIDDEEEED